MQSIEELKRLVISAKDLSEPLNYFFDLADDRTLFKEDISITETEKHPYLPIVIKAVEVGASEKFGKKLTIVKDRFLEIPKHHLIHGVCIFPDFFLPVSVLYFCDIETGLYAFSDLAETTIFRFMLSIQPEMKSIH